MTCLLEESILGCHAVEEISCVSEGDVAALFHHLAHLTSRLQALVVITCAFNYGLDVQRGPAHRSPAETHDDTRGTNFVVSIFGSKKIFAKLRSDTDPKIGLKDFVRFPNIVLFTYQWYI